jgi:hypothetical protein
MASEGAPRRGPGHPTTAPERRGQLLPFPDKRSFGPLRWRTVKIASLAVLLLLLTGAVLQLVIEHALRDGAHARPDTARVPS